MILFISAKPSRLIRSVDFRANKPSDVVSTLVSIYDSKDLFVRELQVLLAQRLLAVTDGNYEKEVCLTRFALISRDSRGEPWTASESGDSQGSLWRSSVAGLRGDAQGYDRFEANRSARSISKFSEYAAIELRDQHADVYTVCDAPDDHISPFLASISDDKDSHAWSTSRVRHFPDVLIFLALNHVQYSRVICTRIY
jgi:hypothetical protein